LHTFKEIKRKISISRLKNLTKMTKKENIS
jgi:hypothetical protein